MFFGKELALTSSSAVSDLNSNFVGAFFSEVGAAGNIAEWNSYTFTWYKSVLFLDLHDIYQPHDFITINMINPIETFTLVNNLCITLN